MTDTGRAGDESGAGGDGEWTDRAVWEATADVYEQGVSGCRIRATSDDYGTTALLLRAVDRVAERRADGEDLPAAFDEAADRVESAVNRLYDPDADDPLAGRDGPTFEERTGRTAVDVFHLANGGSVATLGDPDARVGDPGDPDSHWRDAGDVLLDRVEAVEEAVPDRSGLSRVADAVRDAVGLGDDLDRTEAIRRVEEYAAVEGDGHAAQALLFEAGATLARTAAERGVDATGDGEATVGEALDAVDAALLDAADVADGSFRVEAGPTVRDLGDRILAVKETVAVSADVDGQRAVDARLAAEGVSMGVFPPDRVVDAVEGYVAEADRIVGEEAAEGVGGRTRERGGRSPDR